MSLSSRTQSLIKGDVDRAYSMSSQDDQVTTTGKTVKLSQKGTRKRASIHNVGTCRRVIQGIGVTMKHFWHRKNGLNVSGFMSCEDYRINYCSWSAAFNWLPSSSPKFVIRRSHSLWSCLHVKILIITAILERFNVIVSKLGDILLTEVLTMIVSHALE